MHSLAISCFGPFSAALDGVPITAFESAKVRALLACLAIEPGQPHARSILADLLWPDHSEEQARRNLSQALYNLRSVLGERASSLTFPSDAIQLDLLAGDAVDVAEFSRLLQACDQHPHHVIESCPPCQERLQLAASLYRGELLEGFSLRDSAVFEEWLLSQREAYHQNARRAFASLLACHERLGDTQEALQAARRLAELDPYDDGACQALMRLLAAAGQRMEAMAAYERFLRSLQEDLDLQPEVQTRQLYERLRLVKEDLPTSLGRYTNLPASSRPSSGARASWQRCSGGCSICQVPELQGAAACSPSWDPAAAARAAWRWKRGAACWRVLPMAFFSSRSRRSSRWNRSCLPSPPPSACKSGRTACLSPSSRTTCAARSCCSCWTVARVSLQALPYFLELLGSAPYLKLLATSRARLNVAEEQVFNLAGLPLASADTPKAIASSPAARLFAQRGAPQQPRIHSG